MHRNCGTVCPFLWAERAVQRRHSRQKQQLKAYLFSENYIFWLCARDMWLWVFFLAPLLFWCLILLWSYFCTHLKKISTNNCSHLCTSAMSMPLQHGHIHALPIITLTLSVLPPQPSSVEGSYTQSNALQTQRKCPCVEKIHLFTSFHVSQKHSFNN